MKRGDGLRRKGEGTLSLPKMRTLARIAVPLVGLAVLIGFTALPALAAAPPR